MCCALQLGCDPGEGLGVRAAHAAAEDLLDAGVEHHGAQLTVVAEVRRGDGAREALPYDLGQLARLLADGRVIGERRLANQHFNDDIRSGSASL